MEETKPGSGRKRSDPARAEPPSPNDAATPTTPTTATTTTTTTETSF